jgi:hypothetical protein
VDELIGKFKSSTPVNKASASVLFVAAAKEEKRKNPLWLTIDDLQAHLLKVSFFP